MSSNAPTASAGGVTSQPSPYSVDETLQRLEQVKRNRGLTRFAWPVLPSIRILRPSPAASDSSCRNCTRPLISTVFGKPACSC